MKTKISVLVFITSAAFAPFAAGQGVVPPPAPAQPIPPSLPPALPPIPSVPAQPVAQPTTVPAGTAAGASSGAAGSVSSPVNRPDVGASTATSASSETDSRAKVTPARVDAKTGSRITVDGHVDNTGVTGMGTAQVSGESSASLRTADTMRAIQSTRFATRDQVTADVQARIDATSSLLTDLRMRADAAGDRSKAAFARAMAEVRQREQAVRASLRAATKAASESSWGAVQSQLAKDYDAYAKAVAEAEVAARATK